MKLLHTADLHLGKILHEQSLLEDQAHVLDLLACELEKGNYDLFLIAGDIFDRSVPPPEALALWDDFLMRISGLPGLTIIAISGNHDGALRLSYATRFLETQRIHLRTKPQDLDRPVTITVDGHEWDVFAVPFLPAGSLGAVSESEEPVGLRTQRELWDQARTRLQAARRPGVRSILVAHLFTVGGSETDSERLFLGEAEQIPASWLEGWDYVALGHLHRGQEPVSGVHYSGSPLAYSFSEAGQVKNALCWNEGVLTSIPLVPLRPVTRLTGSFDDFARGEGWQAYREHWLELTLTDAALVPSPIDRLRPRFPRLLSLVQRPLQAAPSESSLVRRRTGDLAADASRFLSDVGLEPSNETQMLLHSLAQEISRETT